MKRIYIIIALICCAVSMQSQTYFEDNEDIRNSLDYLFEHLDKSKVPHGFLRDYAFEMADLDVFNGKSLNDSNYIDRETYENVLRSIRSASVQQSPFIVEDILSDQTNAGSVNQCAIGMILYQYSYIRADALTSNLLRYENEQVYDNYVSGQWQNPYATEYAFAFSPQDTVFSSSVTFNFPATIWKTNVTSINKVEFDAGDGSGYRTIAAGNSYVINYNDGIHELKMRATLSNGTVLTAHTLIRTYGNDAITRLPGDNVSYTNISAMHNGSYVYGTLWHYLRNGSVRKPLIIVEGFDPEEFSNNTSKLSGGYGIQNIYTFTNKVKSNNNSVYTELTTQYDIFYLDMANSTAPIEANAALLKEAINTVNSLKVNDESNIILGHSMGGLIARYGLRQMEIDGEKHEVSLFISQDTPYLGANVPVGALYGVYGILNIYNKYVPGIFRKDLFAEVKAVMHSDAAKQMLSCYVNEEGEINNSVHNSFVANMASMGYPKGDDGNMRCIAISNGSDQINFSNDYLLKATASGSLSDVISGLCGFFGGCGVSLQGSVIGLLTKDWENFILGMIPGKNTVKGIVEIYPTGSSHPVCNIRLTYKKKMLWLVDVQHTFYTFERYTPAGMIQYDISKGSSYSTSVIPTGNKGGEPLLYNYKWGINKVDSFLFIPTVSALDIGEGKTTLTMADYTRTYSMNFYPAPPKHTPFDAYYVSPVPVDHATITRDMLDWINNQLQIAVEGPSIAKTGSTFTLRNNTHNYPVSWESSDTSIATINANGQLTMLQHGYTTITALCQVGNVIQKYHKRIMVGVPAYIINTGFQDTKYRFTYTTNETVSEEYASLLGIQVAVLSSAGGTLTWNDCPSGEYTLPLTEYGDEVNVYFRVVSGTGVVGPTSYVTVCTSRPYTMQPSYLKVSDTGLIDPTFSSTRIYKNPYFTNELPDNMKIMYIGCNSTRYTEILHRATEATLTVEQIFNQNQISAAKRGLTQSSEVILRNDKREILQRFTVYLTN